MPKGICSPFEKKSILHLVMMLGACFCSHVGIAADIDSVLVRQQWPWSTDVKVEYRLSNVTSPVDIKVECFNDGTPLTVANIDKAITGKTYSLSKGDEGIGFFYIDPVKAFGKSQVSLANFTVKLTLIESNALDSEPIYKIIDLETKQVTDLSRADFYNDRGRKYGTYETDFAAIGSSPSKGTPYMTSLENVFIWTGVTNDIAYKTTKLVMRRISAKNKTFMMGSNPNDITVLASDNFQIEVTLTNDYWLGVFEVTRRQSELLAGQKSTSLEESEMTMPYIGDRRHVSYNALRGMPNDWTGWPENIYAVSDSSKIKKIRDLLPGMMFDLPTEAQWEFACRAGTYTQNYSGIPSSNGEDAEVDIAVLAKCKMTSAIKVDYEVGLFRPNAFGLYDILGNVGEAVRDLYDPSKMTQDEFVIPMSGNQTEPMGWTDVTAVCAAGENCKMMYRGGSAVRDYTFNRCSERRQWYGIDATWSYKFGYRLWLYAD